MNERPFTVAMVVPTGIGDIWLDVAPEYLKEYRNFCLKAERLLRPGGKVLAWGDECFKIWLKSGRVALSAREMQRMVLDW